jgi:predicted secreted hydrolase
LVKRRDFVFAGLAFPLVTPGYKLQFPRDHGAHPEHRQEWWYITGWLNNPDRGLQITFFRARPDLETKNPSAFTPRQIILAHAALAEPKHGKLRHDERAGRAALALAGSNVGDTNVWLDDWKLEHRRKGYFSVIKAREFELELQFEPTTSIVLQGENGFSRKGRKPGEASYYYSRPHLKVSGRVNGAPASGTAWLDHEWSSQYMDSEAAGWDWCGLNLDDGSSLMAFRMRGKDGGVSYAPAGVEFKPLRTWKSPRTGTSYPVAMEVVANGRRLRLEPLMDDQELDARASTGTIYWEGAVRAFEGDKPVGKGYLELTGYWRAMKL